MSPSRAETSVPEAPGPGAAVDDGFEAYYAERLWQLLPGVYRTVDTDSFDTAGPLRELVDRIGAQVAVVRRSIDRLWDDQFVETCDGWVLPYVGDLVGTNLVSNLDVRARRLDVAKTIHYRRRKGTLDVLEELAGDVTGWTALVVEGFRRLGRARHGLDPPVGPGALPQSDRGSFGTLLQAEGLTGRLSATPAGGFADLRNTLAASFVGGPFDETFHSADVRRGLGATGHHGLSELLVFLWRLRSFEVVGGTPVAVAGCPGQYVFDPTGRQVPLFLARSSALGTTTAGASASPLEWQVPGPLTTTLERALTDDGADPPPHPPFPDTGVPARYRVGDVTPASIWPELGRFALSATPSAPPVVDYQYGFASTLGAGPYDRNLLGDPPVPPAGPEAVVSGGVGLDRALGAAPTTGTVTIADSSTYTSISGAGSSANPIVSLLVRAGPAVRPVMRPAPSDTPAAPLVFTGGTTQGTPAVLVLDGLTLSGCDLVLRGAFDTVRITACTTDPGTARLGATAKAGADADPSPFAMAVDGAVLAPCRVFVEADPGAPPGTASGIRELLIDHCILGPVRTRLGGVVETVTVSDSILQGIGSTSGTAYTAADVYDPALLVRGLLAGNPAEGVPAYPLSAALLAAMPAAVTTALETYMSTSPATQATAWGSGAADDPAPVVLSGLNDLVSGPCLYDPSTFSSVVLDPSTQELAASPPVDRLGLAALNRTLLDEAYPVALSVAALAVAGAAVELTRVTVMGAVYSHRLSASDSILRDAVVVDDLQQGCVRFSAYAIGSALSNPYESVVIPPGAALFTSDSFGQPGYAQLLETADALVVGSGANAAGADDGAPGAAGRIADSILSGAETGSEMGAFSADLNPLKEQGLLVKFAEYMPLGCTPVIVHVT
jgi:hypothetical protein